MLGSHRLVLVREIEVVVDDQRVQIREVADAVVLDHRLERHGKDKKQPGKREPSRGPHVARSRNQARFRTNFRSAGTGPARPRPLE